jgi:hypothetical protein
MDLKNGYKVIYEKTTSGTRTFYATKNNKCDPTVDDKIIEAEIGKYRLIYEKDGRFYGSETGIPAEGDFCFEAFDRVFVEDTAEPAVANDEPTVPVVEPEKEPEAPETDPEEEIK